MSLKAFFNETAVRLSSFGKRPEHRFRQAAAFLAVFLFCFPAGLQAQAEQEYPPFELQIPAGWTVEYKGAPGEYGQSLKLTSPDRAASYSLSLEALPESDWRKLEENLRDWPEPDHSPPTIQCFDTFCLDYVLDVDFIITFNDKKSGDTGRKIYSKLDSKRYVLQVVLGFHPDLPPLINSYKINERP